MLWLLKEYFLLKFILAWSIEIQLRYAKFCDEKHRPCNDTVTNDQCANKHQKTSLLKGLTHLTINYQGDLRALLPQNSCSGNLLIGLCEGTVTWRFYHQQIPDNAQALQWPWHIHVYTCIVHNMTRNIKYILII